MALFKILKGPEAALPTIKKEGWAYVTNEGNFYVDISDTLRVKINSNADFSIKAENDSSNQKITDTYIKDVIYNQSGTAPYYTLKLGDSTLKATNGVTDKVIIPVASATQAGVITADKTNAQTITGAKIIDKNGSLEIQKAEGFNYSGIQNGTATGARSVWFSHLNSSGTPCINNSFKFDPDETLNIANWSNEKSGTKSSVLHVPHIDGLAYKALRDSQGLVIDDTYIKDVTLTNHATAPYYTLTLGNGTLKKVSGNTQQVLLPVAGSSYGGIITNAAQSISGKKTFLDGIAIKLTTTNTNATYYPWFSTVDSGGIGTPVYNTNFNYNANTNKLTATTFVGSLEGNAATATKLATARTIQTNLASTAAASFNGTTDVTPGVAGILPIAHGGIGASDALSGYYNLAWRGTPTSLNDASSIGFYKINPDVTDTPQKSMWGACMLLTDDAKTIGNTSGSVWQMAFKTASTDLYLRCRTNGTTWQGWHKLLTSNNYSNYCAPAQHTHSYLPLSGGTMTGIINSNSKYAYTGAPAVIDTLTSNNFATGEVLDVGMNGSGIYKGNGDNTTTGVSGSCNLIIKSWYGVGFATSCYNITNKGITLSINTRTGDLSTIGTITGSKVYGAVWNDYAEFRICDEDFRPGQIVLENGDDTLSIASKRLQRGCSIVSDTFGFAIGETDEAKCPIAVSGRVLAYGYESREEFKKHIGWPVCSGPNGTVSIMTEEEEEKYPSRIIGTISAVPDYETWGTGNVKVDGRIWIKVR